MAVARLELTADECRGVLAAVKAARDPELKRAQRELARAAQAAAASEQRERERVRAARQLLPHLRRTSDV